MTAADVAKAVLDGLAGMMTGKSVRLHIQPVRGLHINLYPVRGVKKAAKNARKRTASP